MRLFLPALCLLLIGCRTSIDVEKEAYAQVYPLPPAGPCGGDTTGTYPNCQVATGASGNVAFSVGGDPPEISTAIYQFPPNPNYNPTFPSGGGAFSLYQYDGNFYWWDGSGGYVLVPNPSGTLNSQVQTTSWFRLYDETPNVSTARTFTQLYAGLNLSWSCHFVFMIVGRAITSGGSVAIGDSFVEYLLVAAKMPTGSITASAVGTGTSVLGTFSDTSLSSTTVGVTYSGNPLGSSGMDGYAIVTTTPVTGVHIAWTMQAKGDCN